MKEIDADGIQGRKTPSGRIPQKLFLAFGFAEATPADAPVRDSVEFMFSEGRLWFKFEGKARPQERIVELEYKFAKEPGCEKHTLCDANFAVEGRIIP